MRLTSFLLATAVAMLVPVSAASAQVAVEAPLKAASLYNLTRFVEWPADALPAGAPLTVCVAGDATVAATLQDLVSTRAINGHALAVRRLDVDAADGRCHVLYVAGFAASQLLRLLDAVGSSAVLSVSDADGFARRGGVAQLVSDGGRIGFIVNPDAAARSRLHVSAKLLSLAHLMAAGGR